MASLPAHPELGFYTLAGAPNSPRDMLRELADAEAMGLGTAFISERFNIKEAGALTGAAVAVTNSINIITAATNDDKFRVIAELVGQWEPGLVVVGLPLHPDGAEHAMTVRCRRFANQLHGRFGLETVLIDERYSSAVIAQERGQRIDDVAAAIILQQYFDDHDRS